MESTRTIVHAFLETASRHGNRPGLGWCEGPGTLRSLSWSEYAARVERIGRGLLALGLEPGERVCILGAERPEWPMVALAAMGAGGVPGFIYEAWPAAVQREQVRRCDPAVLVVDRAEGDGLAELCSSLPRLRALVALREAVGTQAQTLDALLAHGAQGPADGWRQRLASLAPEAPASFLLSGGATGEPRRVLASHRALRAGAERLARAWRLNPEDRVLSGLPLAHPAGALAAIGLPAVSGAQLWMPSDPELDVGGLREVTPTVVLGLPALWRQLARAIAARVDREPPSRQKVYAWARRAWHERYRLEAKLQSIPMGLSAQCRLAQTLVVAPLKLALGLAEARLLASAGAGPLPSAVRDELTALDLPVFDTYGLAEAGGLVSANAPVSVRWESQGRPLAGTAVRIDAQGQLRLRGAGLAAPEPGGAGRVAFDDEGWLLTGDFGTLDEEGFVSIDGRAEDRLALAGGRRVWAPRIERRLESVALVERAAAFGEGLEAPVALITLDREEALRLAQRLGLPADPVQLAANPDLHRELQVAFAAAQARSGEPAVERFEVLPESFSAAAGELTPVGALRRKAIALRHGAALERLAGGEGAAAPQPRATKRRAPPRPSAPGRRARKPRG